MEKRAANLPELAELFSEDNTLFQTALTHSSWAFERGLSKEYSNERLEFLGDAILELCISLALYNLEPNLDEGRMTQIRSVLIREETLVLIAQDLHLGEYLRVGKGEAASGGKEKPSNLANALEAVIAAFYLHYGLEDTSAWLRKLYKPYYRLALEGKLIYDFKSTFQEYVQKEFPEQIIRYTIVHEEGPDHARIFTSELSLSDEVIATGKGKSKKEAEQAASKRALEILGKDIG